MHFVNSKLHKGQFIPGGYWRFLFITTRVEIHSPKIFCIQCIMSKSSTSVNRKALKLDDKVKAINHCNGGKSCWAVGKEMGIDRTQIMNIL